MSSGELDERVSLQRLTPKRDGAGGATETWAEYAEVWAKVRPMTGRERENAARTEALSDYVVKIRYRADVRAADRIVWRDRELNVRFMKDRGPRELYLELEAQMGVKS